MRQLFSCLLLSCASFLHASLADLPLEVNKDYRYTITCDVTLGTTGLEHSHEEVLRINEAGDFLAVEGEIVAASTRLKMQFRGINMVGPWAHGSFEGKRVHGVVGTNGRCKFSNRNDELVQACEGRAMPMIKRETLKAQKEIVWALLEKSGDVPYEPCIVSPQLTDPLSLEKEQYTDAGFLFSHWVGSVAAREMPMSEWENEFAQLGNDGDMALRGLKKIAETQGIKLEDDTVTYMEGEVTQEGKWNEGDHFCYEFVITGSALVKANGREMPVEIDLQMRIEEE